MSFPIIRQVGYQFQECPYIRTCGNTHDENNRPGIHSAQQRRPRLLTRPRFLAARTPPAPTTSHGKCTVFAPFQAYLQQKMSQNATFAGLLAAKAASSPGDANKTTPPESAATQAAHPKAPGLRGGARAHRLQKMPRRHFRQRDICHEANVARCDLAFPALLNRLIKRCR